jgi:hypothetical protein
MQHNDIIEIKAVTTTRRRIQPLIRRIYEYEENIEVWIATNSNPEREDTYPISTIEQIELSYELENIENKKVGK